MRLLAIDQASYNSGVAIFEDGNLIYSGVIKLKRIELGKRLVQLKKEILSLIKEYNIDTVIFEDIQLQKNVSNNVKTYKTLAELRGVLEVILTEEEIPYSDVLSSVWRKAIGIKGKTREDQKENAVNFVLSTYNKAVTNDEADAICIGNFFIKDNKNNWTA